MAGTTVVAAGVCYKLMLEEEEETLFVNGMYNYIVWVQSSTIKQ